jgi:hypothetical protein
MEILILFLGVFELMKRMSLISTNRFAFLIGSNVGGWRINEGLWVVGGSRKMIFGEGSVVGSTVFFDRSY